MNNLYSGGEYRRPAPVFLNQGEATVGQQQPTSVESCLSGSSQQTYWDQFQSMGFKSTFSSAQGSNSRAESSLDIGPQTREASSLSSNRSGASALRASPSAKTNTFLPSWRTELSRETPASIRPVSCENMIKSGRSSAAASSERTTPLQPFGMWREVETEDDISQMEETLEQEVEEMVDEEKEVDRSLAGAAESQATHWNQFLAPLPPEQSPVGSSRVRVRTPQELGELRWPAAAAEKNHNTPLADGASSLVVEESLQDELNNSQLMSSFDMTQVTVENDDDENDGTMEHWPHLDQTEPDQVLAFPLGSQLSQMMQTLENDQPSASPAVGSTER